MSRPKKGEPGYEESVSKWRESMERRYGDVSDFFREIGHKGGTTESDKPKGFAADHGRASWAGRKGGLRTKRGYSWIEDVDEWHGRYINQTTGEKEVLKYKHKMKLENGPLHRHTAL